MADTRDDEDACREPIDFYCVVCGPSFNGSRYHWSGRESRVALNPRFSSITEARPHWTKDCCVLGYNSKANEYLTLPYGFPPFSAEAEEGDGGCVSGVANRRQIWGVVERWGGWMSWRGRRGRKPDGKRRERGGESERDDERGRWSKQGMAGNIRVIERSNPRRTRGR
jgi:hypothetical protein